MIKLPCKIWTSLIWNLKDLQSSSKSGFVLGLFILVVYDCFGVGSKIYPYLFFQYHLQKFWFPILELPAKTREISYEGSYLLLNFREKSQLNLLRSTEKIGMKMGNSDENSFKFGQKSISLYWDIQRNQRMMNNSNHGGENKKPARLDEKCRSIWNFSFKFWDWS